MSPIPAADLNGLLPPFEGGNPANLQERAPYQATVQEVVDRFATSLRRCTILEGFLRYRADLRACGPQDGLQWIDGSFCESVTDPNDIDVVTFVFLDQAMANAIVAANLTDVAAMRANYLCDSYYVTFPSTPELIIRMTSYWYGLFAHCRATFLWKGLISVSLNDQTEAGAAALLAQRRMELANVPQAQA